MSTMKQVKFKTIVSQICVSILVFVILFLGICLIVGDEEENAPVSTSEVTSVTTQTETVNMSGSTEENAVSENSGAVTELTAVRQQLNDIGSAETVTVMLYMNGSNLESDDGSATEDIKEMLSAPYSDDVHIVMQTMGTKSWKSTYGISSSHSQRWLFGEDDLILVDDTLSQLDCTAAETLADFIMWSVGNYPADRYILILWDHGGGPVYGFGYDEWQDDEDAALTLDEIQQALYTANVDFDFIGMDACIMASLEVCCALYEYCDYTILSEEFEPGTGWSYQGWLTALTENPAIDTVSLATILIDDMITANSGKDGDSATLALIDESVMTVLFSAWMEFAYANEDALLELNYSQEIDKSSRAKGFFSDWLYDEDDEYSLSDYYITDIMAVAQNIDSDESAALSSAVSNAIVYYAATSDITSLTGLSVTIPYGDSEFYDSLATIFTNCGFDSTYVEWLSAFVEVDSSDYYSYEDEWDDWFGWDDYEDDYDWLEWEDNWSDEDMFGWEDIYTYWETEMYDDMDGWVDIWDDWWD